MQIHDSDANLRLQTFPVPPRVRPSGAASQRRTGDGLRRLVNVVVAAIAVVLAAPLMLAIGMLVKLSSPGPVIYRQPRVGLNRRSRSRAWDGQDRRGRTDKGGRIFTIYKFRTMRCDVDSSQVWATRDDPRVTVVGRFLRATRLDELPQLFNVLKGDMNIVGPRPEQPDIFADLSAEVVGYRARQNVLPGITGWAQINAGYDEDLDGVRRKVQLDLEYIGRRSTVEDLSIMARTVPVVVLQKVWEDRADG